MFDFPIFKRLPKNDTADAKGNQDGVVIPVGLADYFPELPTALTAETPTAEKEILVDLYFEDEMIGRQRARYQHQSWKGERSVERRITRIRSLRKRSHTGDLLLIQRHTSDLDYYKLCLIPKSGSLFKEYDNLASGRSAGVLDATELPVTNQDLTEAQKKVSDTAANSFQPFANPEDVKLTRAKRIARSQAFRRNVLKAYDNRCAVTGTAIVAPNGAIGCDAAHIISKESNGVDDVRNGLCLTKNLHWAFDRGMFSIDDDCRVMIADEVKSAPGNDDLKLLEGQKLRVPAVFDLAPHSSALNWHRENVLLKKI